MNKKNLKNMGAMSLAILILMLYAQISVFAQSSKTESASSEQGLIGSWDSQVTIRDCQSGTALASFLTMVTFNQGGTMAESGNDPGPSLRATGHGVWSQERARTYSRSFRFFRFNPDGTFAGSAKISGQLTLDRSGRTLTGVSTFNFLDPSGNVIVAGCATETGTRFE